MNTISNQQLIPTQEHTATEIQQVTQQLTQSNKPLQNSDIEIQQLTHQLQDSNAEIQRLTQQQTQSNKRLQDRDAENQLLTQTSQQLTQSKQQLTQSNRQLQRTNAENQQLVATLRSQIDVLQRRVSSAPSNAQELEFWQVSPDEVSVRKDQILGRGAWGYVAKGTFRGTTVAVKRVYTEILQQTTVERIRREIRTMAQIRHPNLVLFIAAVLSEETGPMIVTELLDISLREAYQTNCVGPNKRRIFEDVSSALLYLHRQKEPVIHRDVSSANVLLGALPNNSWLAKLSDFGSANLVRDATTPGEGAILYTAPEAFPQGPYSPQPRPQQTTKIDVYSFGVLACEVVTQTFPKTEVFHELLSGVSRVWRELHPLIVSCVSHSPHNRPSMDIVLQQLKEMDYEP